MNQTQEKLIWLALGLFAGFVLLGAFTRTALASKAPKVTICHATESETNPYTRIVVSQNAIGGHFENPGTPKAGHEDDLLLEGDVECPTPEPDPTPTPEVTPTPTIEPDLTPSATPTPVPAREHRSDGRSDGKSDGKSDGLCSQPPCVQNLSGQPLLPTTAGK